MSERVQPDPNEALFSSLDVVHMEPTLTRVFDQMRLYNQLLLWEPVSSSRINEIMRELDDEWRLLISERAIFTGIARFPEETTADQVTQDCYHEELPVVFGGVLPYQLEDRNISSDPDTPKYYELRLLLKHVDSEVRGDTKLDEVAQLDFAYKISSEHATRILEHSQPALLEAVNAALQHPAEHECELAGHLTELVYDPQEDEQHTINQTALALNHLTNEQLIFDKNIGYAVTIDGRYWRHKEGQWIVEGGEGQMLAKVQQVVWSLTPHPGDKMYTPHLSVILCGKKANEISDVIHLPLTSIKSLTSLRHEFFSDDKSAG